MKGIQAYMYRLIRIQDFQVRSITAYIFLCLVSISFIVEHIPFVESDILELLESTEKEKESKDKKLLVYGEGIFARSENEDIINNIYADIDNPSNGICIDILTPPPEIC